MTRLAAVLTLALGLAGCHQASRTASSGGWNRVKPERVLLPVEQAHLYAPARAGTDPAPTGAVQVMPRDVRAVQEDGPVSVVFYNRYADPQRPDELMHEAHVVYRREGAPRWRLRTPPPDQQLLVGPAQTDGRGEVRGLASQELEAHLREQQSLQKAHHEMVRRLADGVGRLAAQQEQLARELGSLKLRQISGQSGPTGVNAVENPEADRADESGAAVEETQS